jgi:hypothetical protein
VIAILANANAAKRAAPAAPVVTLTPASLTVSRDNVPQAASLVATWAPAGTATVTVDWGDGVGVQSFPSQSSGVDVGALAAPNYLADGPYTAAVTVTPDATGLTGTRTAGVTATSSGGGGG